MSIRILAPHRQRFHSQTMSQEWRKLPLSIFLARRWRSFFPANCHRAIMLSHGIQMAQCRGCTSASFESMGMFSRFHWLLLDNIYYLCGPKLYFGILFFAFMQRILFLASQSPRRASLVKLLGVGPIGFFPADIEESMDIAMSPSENVERLALHKARIIADEMASM